jgi:hypothetical protein
MVDGTAERSAGTLGRLQAPLAITTLRHLISPVLVRTSYPSSDGRTLVTWVFVRTGARATRAKSEMNATTSAIVM